MTQIEPKTIVIDLNDRNFLHLTVRAQILESLIKTVRYTLPFGELENEEECANYDKGSELIRIALQDYLDDLAERCTDEDHWGSMSGSRDYPLNDTVPYWLEKVGFYPEPAWMEAGYVYNRETRETHYEPGSWSLIDHYGNEYEIPTIFHHLIST